MNTYPEMNDKIVGILQTGGEPSQYAAQRIEELEVEIERLRGLLDGLVHLHDTDRIVQAHQLLGRINAIVKSYQSPEATARKLVERMQARKET